MNKQTPRRGFTLIELLTVIAIIGILAGILIPTVGNVMENARKTQTSSNGRQIALAYNTYALDGPRIKNIAVAAYEPRTAKSANSVHEWAAVLAVKAGLNDASFWFVGDDDAAPSVFPTTVLSPGEKTIDGDFSSEDGVAWNVVGELARSAPASTTPLLWSRGYNDSDGTWKDRGTSANSSSPWGDQGGHVVYLDAHVIWKSSGFDEDDSGDFINLSTGRKTKSLTDAVGANSGNTKIH